MIWGLRRKIGGRAPPRNGWGPPETKSWLRPCFVVTLHLGENCCLIIRLELISGTEAPKQSSSGWRNISLACKQKVAIQT